MALEYKGSLSRYRRYLQTVRERPLVRASLWIVFSLLLIITMVVAALKPTLTTISSLLGQIKQEEEISARLDEKIRTVQAASKNLDAAAEKIPMLDEAMPSETKWKELANRLEKEATDSGILVQSLSVEKIPVKGKYISEKTTVPAREEKIELPAGTQKVDIVVQAIGKYGQFIDYISRLEKMRRIIAITSINIDKDEKGQLTLTINGYAIYSSI